MVSRNITVTTPDARRAIIKVTSDDHMMDVLERACAKFSLSSDKYFFR